MQLFANMMPRPALPHPVPSFLCAVRVPACLPTCSPARPPETSQPVRQPCCQLQSGRHACSVGSDCFVHCQDELAKDVYYVFDSIILLCMMQECHCDPETASFFKNAGAGTSQYTFEAGEQVVRKAALTQPQCKPCQWLVVSWGCARNHWLLAPLLCCSAPCYPAGLWSAAASLCAVLMWQRSVVPHWLGECVHSMASLTEAPCTMHIRFNRQRHSHVEEGRAVHSRGAASRMLAGPLYAWLRAECPCPPCYTSPRRCILLPTVTFEQVASTT